MIELNTYDKDLKKSATTALKALSAFLVSLAIINFIFVIMILLLAFGFLSSPIFS